MKSNPRSRAKPNFSHKHRKLPAGHLPYRMMLAAAILMTVAAFASCPGMAENPPVAETLPECVILLHGLGRTPHSMAALAERLQQQGYSVWNKGYPSTREPIDALVVHHVLPAIRWAESLRARKIHFVTHSLGGILVRSYLQENRLPDGSRVVMISPPNKGSEIADKLKPFFLFKWLMGPAGQQLGTSPESVPNRLKPVTADIGVITGTGTVEPWSSLLIPGEDDGKVSVESAKLGEMNDFLTVSCSHPWIMRNREVIDQVVYYLQHGCFNRQDAARRTPPGTTPDDPGLP